MGNLMEYDLFDLIQRTVGNQVLADRNSSGAEIALTCPSHRSVKTKAEINKLMLFKKTVRHIYGLGLQS